ncbi:hypothetical protein A2U01_0106973, partial [Trifolium medium]|nr:hypothetical protein [Trifolium medium]
MNKGSEILDEILEAGKRSDDKKGLGFDNSYSEKVNAKKEDPSK